jgi:hypothetical protein
VKKTVDLTTTGTIHAGFYVTTIAAGLIQNDVVLTLGNCAFPFVAFKRFLGDYQ